MFVRPEFLIPLYAAASVATILLFALDKIEAQRQGVRISESALLMVSFVGGWPGALLAQRTFHHKTRKRSFQLRFWAIVVSHIAVVASLAYMA